MGHLKVNRSTTSFLQKVDVHHDYIPIIHNKKRFSYIIYTIKNEDLKFEDGKIAVFLKIS